MKRLYELRKEKEKTQREFAKELGVSHTYISDIEAGRKTPSHLFLLAIEYKYGVRTEWLQGKGEKYAPIKTLDKTEEELIKALRENPRFKNIVLQIKKLISG